MARPVIVTTFERVANEMLLVARFAGAPLAKQSSGLCRLVLLHGGQQAVVCRKDERAASRVFPILIGTQS